MDIISCIGDANDLGNIPRPFKKRIDFVLSTSHKLALPICLDFISQSFPMTLLRPSCTAARSVFRPKALNARCKIKVNDSEGFKKEIRQSDYIRPPIIVQLHTFTSQQFRKKTCCSYLQNLEIRPIPNNYHQSLTSVPTWH